MDWTSGYVADVAYTAGYFNELNPARLPLALLNAGYAPPKIENACELGFGQGVSIAMHAAAQPGVNWFGDDFNPSHAAAANWMADAAGAKAVLTDESFAEFCNRDDLPDFDFIGLHGIWSWISEENRALIVDFLRRKLRVGGVAYISYNVLPGWAAAMPLRDLMARHGQIMGSNGQSSLTKLEAAMGFADQFFALNPVYMRANAGMMERFEALKAMPKAYLAHEYLNRDWKPMYFTEIAAQLHEAKLDFACTAGLSDAVEEAHLTAEQREFLAGIENEDFREMARDYLCNTQFRRDYWIKGSRTMSQAERFEAIRATRVILSVPREGVPKAISTTLGQVSLQEAIYDPFLDVLADHKPHTIGEIEQALALKGIALVQVLQAVMLLGGINSINFPQPDKAIAAARPTARKLNAALIEQSRSGEAIGYLASPVTGGGVPLARFEQIFLASIRAGRRTPKEWAADAWALVNSQGQKLLRDGAPIQSDADNLAELESVAARFADTLPMLRGLEIVEVSAPQSGQKRG